MAWKQVACFFVCLLAYFETGSHYVAWASLELAIETRLVWTMIQQDFSSVDWLGKILGNHHLVPTRTRWKLSDSAKTHQRPQATLMTSNQERHTGSCPAEASLGIGHRQEHHFNGENGWCERSSG